MSSKTSLLIRSEILELFGDTLTADHIYSPYYLREISATCSNAIISKRKIFSIFFIEFSQSTQNFAHFEKIDQLHRLKISEFIDSEKCGYLNARKFLFQNVLLQSTCSPVLNTAEMNMPALLSETSINLRHIEFENISVCYPDLMS